MSGKETVHDQCDFVSTYQSLKTISFHYYLSYCIKSGKERDLAKKIIVSGWHRTYFVDCRCCVNEINCFMVHGLSYLRTAKL